MWVICATIAGSWALSYAFRATAQEAFDARLISLLTLVIGLAEVNPNGQLQLARGIGDPQFESVYSGWYWLVADGSAVRLSSRSLWDMSFPVPNLPVSASPTVWSTRDAMGREVRVAAQSVILPAAAEPFTFAVTGDLGALHAQARRFDWITRIALGVLGIGLVLAVWMQVKFGLRPLRRLAREVEAVRTGSAEQLARSGTRELDLLVDEVNTLIEHNRRIVERARDSAADLAHALKTPLAIMQSAHVEHGERADEHREQIAAMERIITRHLTRASVAGPGRRAPAPIAPIVDELARGLTRVHTERALQVTSDIQADLAYPADRQDLEEMIGNLMENAYKWARRRIRIAGRSSGERVLLSIEDDGPGLDFEQADEAAERGRRFDERTPGTGLGLAIVTDIAEIYSGSLKLERSDLGGLAAELTLPVVRNEHIKN